MLYALNDLLASFVFIDCIIVWKFMLKCVLRVRIKIYIYINSSEHMCIRPPTPPPYLFLTVS